MDTPHQQIITDFFNFVIRQVTKADLPALEWEGEYLMFRRMFATLYQGTLAGNTLMWVIEHPGSGIIGQAFVMLKSGERGAADGKNRAYVFSFRVKSQWRNRGIGKYLMAFIEDDLRKRGFKFVTLNVAQDNPAALRLYEHLGYQIINAHAGVWSFIDHEGNLQHVNEPSWRMMKRIGT
jgi:ribosomal protein S18 acetylase RimI-like enzyme